MRFFWCWFVIGLGSVIAPRDAVAASKWTKLQTDDFVIYSNSSDRDLVEFAVGYAGFRHAFREFLAPGAALPPSTILLFRSQDTLRPYLPPATDRNMEITTFTAEVDAEALMTLSLAGNRTQALEQTFEFETGWALRRLGYFLPLWMSQGTGEVLASLQVKKDRSLLGDGPERFSDLWRRARPLPWERFFELSFGSPEYSGAKADGTAQAQSWALMHRILLGGRGGRERFEALAEKLRTSSATDAVQAVVGLPPKDWEKDISNHLRSRDSRREIPFDAALVRAELKPESVTEAELQMQLANLLVATGKPVEAEAAFAQARAAMPDAAAVKEWLARRELRRNDREEAARLYREAIAAGSHNSVAYLVSAMQRLSDSQVGGVDRAGGGGQNIEVALTEIHQAIRLNPGNGDAYRLMGRALFVHPKPTREQLAGLTPGLASGPGSDVVLLYRGLVEERLEMWSEAAADYRRLVEAKATGPSTRRNAAERLDAVERRAAR